MRRQGRERRVAALGCRVEEGETAGRLDHGEEKHLLELGAPTAGVPGRHPGLHGPFGVEADPRSWATEEATLGMVGRWPWTLGGRRRDGGGTTGDTGGACSGRRAGHRRTRKGKTPAYRTPAYPAAGEVRQGGRLGRNSVAWELGAPALAEEGGRRQEGERWCGSVSREMAWKEDDRGPRGL
jgi:hypothetical protein